MQALSQEILAGNAFRVLGLPADAGQAAIDSAARRMRLWSDPAQIPPTPWDLPWLGALRRGRPDIEFALARLADPISRINQRLFWFTQSEAVPPLRRPGRIFGRRLELSSCPPIIGDAAFTSHDAALSRLASAIVADPTAQSPRRWGSALADFCQSTGSLDYRDWFVSVESEGNFEKEAGRDEILRALAGLPGSIAESLATRARDALDHDRTDTCMQLIGLVRAAGSEEQLRRRLETGICDRIEDMLTARCKQIRDDLFRNIQWDAGSSIPAARANRLKCRSVAKQVRKSINPLFDAMAVFDAPAQPGDAASERMKRVGVHASGMLRNLGLAWGRVGQRRRAGQIFQRAVQLTDDREMAAKLKIDLANLKTQKKKPAATTGVRRRWVALVVVLGAISRFAAHWPHDSNSTPRSDLPDLRELEHEQEMHNWKFQPPPAMTPTPAEAQAVWERFFHPPATQPTTEPGANPSSQPATRTNE